MSKTIADHAIKLIDRSPGTHRVTPPAKPLLLACCCCWIAFSGLVRADEPAELFLVALRDAGYFDIALEYLDSLENKPEISAEFRKIIPFEKAETLIASTRQLRDPAVMDQRLNQANQLLVEYANRDLDLESRARLAQYQASLWLQRSKISSFRANSDRLTAPEREAVHRQTRELLQLARDSYQDAKDRIRELIDPRSASGIKVDPQDPVAGERLKKFQRDFVKMKLGLAQTTEELADTFTELDGEWSQLVNEALVEYKSIFNDYLGVEHANDSVWLSKLYEGRCLAKLGQLQPALRTLNEIFELKGRGAVPLKRQAYLISCDAWSQLDEYPAADVVRILEPAVEELNPEERRQPDWVKVQFELAVAQHRLGELRRNESGARARTESDRLQRQAGRAMRNLSRIPGSFQEPARELMAQWNVNLSESEDANSLAAIESFADARLKSRELVSEMETLFTEINSRRQQLTTADEEEQANIRDEMQELREQLDSTVAMTLELVTKSRELADEETPTSDLNQLRYVQSYAHFMAEQYIESALIGEFMLNKFPTAEWTRQAMSLLVQSYQIQFSNADPDQRDFERGRLVTVCQQVLDRWPGSDESGRAALSMIGLTLSEGDFVEAQKYFLLIPESFSARSLIAIQLGTQLWIDYRQQMAPGSTVSPRLDAEQQQHQLQQVRHYLETGIQSAPQGNISFELALAGRYLVEALLELEQPESALQILEGSSLSPLDLVKTKHPAIFDHPAADIFTRETYKVALKNYLEMLRQTDAPDSWIEKIRGVLSAMRQEADETEDPRLRAQLSQTYSLIANELLTRFDSIGELEKKQKFAASLLVFLNSIEKDSNDGRTILWAGATALSVANSLTAAGQGATRLYDQAVTALNRAEEVGFNDDPQQEVLLLELQRQRGLALRGNQKFEQALDQFAAVLEKQRQNVRVQIDAAQALQMWGVSSRRSQPLIEAIKGTRRQLNPETRREANLIWGWEMLAKATRGKNDEIFYQALYHWSQCRLEYGLIENSSSTIAAALREIENEEKRSPEMGGAEWKAKFENLKQEIQSKL